MKRKNLLILVPCIAFLYSCSIIEKSSKHGFYSDFYQFKTDKNNIRKVYLDISEDTILAVPINENGVKNEKVLTFSLSKPDSLYHYPLKFSKKSLDVDITTILFKFRPGMDDLPPQLNTDFNIALYTGWRRDNFSVQNKIDPLNKNHISVNNRGFDFGVFAGPGTTLVGPFSTRNKFSDEYNGMILQFGLAGFIESNIASFGISAGYDYLLSHDRKIWIYNKKPWIGFIVGIAMN